MAPSDDGVTRNEFNLLNSKVDNLSTRIESIDRDGTRGVLALQAQLSDTVKDLSEIKIDLASFKMETATKFDKLTDGMRDRFDKVEVDTASRFDKLTEERTNSRRWVIGTVIAGAAAFAGLYVFLADLITHVH